MKIIHNALVITPTVASDNLIQCAKSVLNQTYDSVHHLFVVDGAEHNSKFNGMMLEQVGWHQSMINMHLPWNVGKDGGAWYGHRVYASIPKLIPKQKYDYVFLLDEDNWFEPNHVETCIETLNNNNLDFSHSLRRVCDVDGTYLIDDNCESLGKWPIYGKPGHNLVDTSSFCFRYDFIRNNCHLWDSGWGGDRRFLAAVYNQAKWDGTGKHTLNYRLGGNDGSVTEQFFIDGNKMTALQNAKGYPWIKT